MFTVETRAGRLVEVFIASPFPIQEVEGMTQAVRLQVVAATEPILLCARLDQLREEPAPPSKPGEWPGSAPGSSAPSSRGKPR